MNNVCHTRNCSRTFIAAGILLVLVFGAYSNTFHSSWQLDDYPTIVHNSRLHLKDLAPQSLAAAFYSRPGVLGNAYRPVSCLSLALNWYLGGQRVAGYHFVNISIHFLTAFILYLTIFNLFQSPRMAKSNSRQAFKVGLLAAVLWALNPGQTQAVTYIVQRMASLAAMFYVLGLYCYVKGRSARGRWQPIFFFTAVFLSFALAVWSKENAIIMPLALILTEIVFFQNLDSARTLFRVRATAAVIGFFLLTGLICAVSFSNHFSILNGYQDRAFTLGQRLLTEPRVIVLYLSQLFYPMPQRLSIEHALEVSTSVWEPWTTLPALALVVILVVIGIHQVNKRPLLAFALLFYLLNQLVESTVLPLELVFEHRNYLPSLFLFWPVAAWFFVLVDNFQQKSGPMAAVLVSFMVLLVIGLGVSTYTRNNAWSTETTLWEDAMRKAPGRARPTYNLAKQYTRAGRLDAARMLYHRALTEKGSRPRNTKALALNGIAGIHYKKGDFEGARDYGYQALEVKPNFDSARKNLVLVLAKLNQWDKIEYQIDFLLRRRKNSKVYQFLKGELLLKQNQPGNALVYFRQALKSAPQDKKILLNIGMALSRLGHYRQSEWFWHRVKKRWPGDIRPYLYLIEVGQKTNNMVQTERYLDDLIARFTLKRLTAEQPHCFEDAGLSNTSRKLICDAVNAKIMSLAEDMVRKGGSNWK